MTVTRQGGDLTSAASAAFLRASSVSPEASAAEPLPKVLGGPPTFVGTGAVPAAGAGAEPKTLPGCEKASGSVFPQMLPMAANGMVR